MLRVYLSKNQFKQVTAEPEVVRSTTLRGVQGDIFKPKRRIQRMEIFDWLQMKAELVAGDLLSLGFNFVNLKHLQA